MHVPLAATKHLDQFAAADILDNVKVGRSNFDINVRLFAILTGAAMQPQADTTA